MLNQWWNGAVTWNNSTGWVLYLNGVQVDTDSNTADPNITSISKKISDCLGLNVKIKYNEKNQRSKTTILCTSLEQLNSLVEKLEKH